MAEGRKVRAPGEDARWGPAASRRPGKPAPGSGRGSVAAVTAARDGQAEQPGADQPERNQYQHLLARALGLLQAAPAARPTDPGIAYHLAQALVAAGDPTAARQLLLTIADRRFDEQPAAMALLQRLRP